MMLDENLIKHSNFNSIKVQLKQLNRSDLKSSILNFNSIKVQLKQI